VIGAFSQGGAETAVYPTGTADVEAKAQVMELLDDNLTELNRQDPVPGTCQQYRVTGHRELNRFPAACLFLGNAKAHHASTSSNRFWALQRNFFSSRQVVSLTFFHFSFLHLDLGSGSVGLAFGSNNMSSFPWVIQAVHLLQIADFHFQILLRGVQTDVPEKLRDIHDVHLVGYQMRGCAVPEGMGSQTSSLAVNFGPFQRLTEPLPPSGLTKSRTVIVGEDEVLRGKADGFQLKLMEFVDRS
jgi:hypothetical protein